MRGKLPGWGASGGRGGLIPAHAGKTPNPAKVWDLSWAHPRACGENDFPALDAVETAGSSPRMRGKPCLWYSHARARGLIPAHAGKTTQSARHSLILRAHPRACGENLKPTALRRRSAGSSPRMRGKRLPEPCSWRCFGLIPAHAGKTLWEHRDQSGQRAHPRACGENLIAV